jgi:Rieske 2Fe-2S family protein
MQFTLPQQYFASEDIFHEEWERIFSDHWICVGRAEQLANPGDYFLKTIGHENIIILRDQEGQARAFYNICRHRGTRLCSQDRGHLKGSIQCPYHAWTYALDGRLTGVPSVHRMPEFDPADFPLHPVALELWHGIIFINLAPEPKPLATIFGDDLALFDPWRIGDLVTVTSIDYHVKANWKIIVQNFSECYHCPVAHPEFNRLTHFESGATIFEEGPLFGGTMIISRPDGGASLSGQRSAPPLQGIAVEALQELHFYHLFPNTLLILAPDHVVLYTLTPQAPNRTMIHCDWLFQPDTIANSDFDASDTVQLWDVTNRQDWFLCEQTQLGVQSRAYAGGPYYEFQESVLAAFDQRVLDALGHDAA